MNRIGCLLGAAVFTAPGLASEAEVARLGAEVRAKGWIIFSAITDAGDWDLFLARPDGSGRKAVTRTSEFNEAGGRFSPDGKKLLYYRMPKGVRVDNNTYGKQELVIAEGDGSRPVVLGNEFPWASWGPGGGRIACLVPDGIQIVDVESRKRIRSIPRKGIFQQLAWSPDGKAFLGTANGLGPAWNIGRLDAESGEMKALSEVERYNCTPDWFPDSRRAIYSRGIIPEKDGRAELWAADADGDRRTLVYAEEDRHIYGGCVSPDGRHIIFTRSEGDLGDPRREIAMALIRLADFPMAVGTSKAWLDAHPDSRPGPRFDLGMGWEPDWTLSEAPAGGPPPASAGPVVLGPARDVATIVRFGAEPAGAWAASGGQNVEQIVTPGRRLPGLADAVLEAQVRRKDRGDGEAGHNWFSLKRKDLPLAELPAEIDGFRLVLGSAAEAKWWISMALTTAGGEGFSVVLEPTFPAGRLVEWLLPFERFRSAKDVPLDAEKARTIRAISFATSSPGTSLFLDRITAYRRERLRGWLDFGSSHPSNHLFERADPVSIALSPGGAPPAGAEGIRYEVRDHDDKVTERGAARLSGAPRYEFAIKAPAPGYYEVAAYWTDAAGKDLEPHSAIRAEGTVPEGRSTFAVLPHLVAENLARSRELGESAFFGLHGDFLDLADHVGLTWRFDYTGWKYEEPARPDRSSGPAPWAQKALGLPPRPAERLHIQSFRLNHEGETPEWARAAAGTWPGFAWDDALGMVRDCVKVEKHRYPHMKHRLYGGLWEVDLNAAPHGVQKPPFSPAEIAEAYRRIHEVVKAEDPGGMVIGPCSSIIRPGWFEEVFKTGVLDHLDGIETHAYCEGTFTPEAGDLAGRIQRLNALVLRYHGGQPLPIYITEAGYPGLLGTEVVHRSQAELMVRTCIILKGEGVRVFLPFYGIDYDRAECFGFLFNLDVGAPSGPWSTRRTSPKPMVIAVAVCVDMLEGAMPRGRVAALDPEVWAYEFRRGDTTITAVWAPAGQRAAVLSVGSPTVEVVDMMGRRASVAAKGGAVALIAREAPVYVVRRTQ